MAKRLNWFKYGISFWGMLSQHISVAGMTWLGIAVKDNDIRWDTLWIAMLAGAVLPTFFKFIGAHPTPDYEDDIVINEPDPGD